MNNRILYNIYSIYVTKLVCNYFFPDVTIYYAMHQRQMY